ncbi:MAG: hypothetical protein K0S01_2816 [Herbinix sp.]|jgi:hypothetical protein|nr:hypothetical protein [Herbinix sp.]
MQNTYIWRLIPSNQPVVIRSCPKCGNHSEYESTGNFRINANQNNIDVWLIYQCCKCKSTWNMEILSRIKSKSINKELYNKFLKNDQELARFYAFDLVTHSRNKSNLSYENITFEILADRFTLSHQQENIWIELICDYPLDIRLDKILSKQLGISRELIKKMGNNGQINGIGIRDITKVKVNNGMLINILL